jgi:hypothetical protein
MPPQENDFLRTSHEIHEIDYHDPDNDAPDYR